MINQETLVRSNGIFHGLPTYPSTPGTQNLTALVAGATGLSGSHMVKVLAASQRWRKIYCLSSRPPPENFFADLGDGSGKVEHVAIDFLRQPAQIAECLSDKIEHVDHVFYFSYMQPPPKGDALDLWAHADELARINRKPPSPLFQILLTFPPAPQVSLFKNFVGGLQLAGLKPKKFMLQTGSKHYAFYLGPAAIPAFESDPRVTIDDNFYYAQEDALASYCKLNGSQWAVSRPTYIIGAVRDGSLNHLIGFGIYASVQAYRKQPLLFPGDYRAWDREQHQSSGLLNAYFQEWLVLSESTAGEAFNIHDGDSFTWGRLWPYLAQWYGIEWHPPETDDSKYRTVKMALPTTPRGYGPQATMRSTFSLLEWSLKPEVEQAWKEIAHKHDLVLNPFDPLYRARIFSFSDSAVIGDGAMTLSMRKARNHGFFGTLDSYRSIFDSLHELARLKMIMPPVVGEFVE
ncbi:unnamed protein product [Clonostachys rhizophaga]|uniref:PRISE-like Rossmann-fold domain-containing protein n=1 Tax=Clonostachys rhizophaga TaxID=160324 RepID=A0A9N9VAD6_9HYPO|nr:unnamed protein product [Clonostachys rhizophaga]